MRLLTFFLVASATALVSIPGDPQPTPSPEEQILNAAGLSSDGDALLEFFRERMRPTANLQEMLQLARKLGAPNAETRAQATAKLLAAGSWAVPALRHVVNDLDNPLAAKHARHCLNWLEGQHGRDLLVASAKLLAARKPAEAAPVLLAFLPFAGDQAVVDGVKTALDTIAGQPGKADAALLAALTDPLPLRRAIAVEVLAASGRPEVMPSVRKLLVDAKPLVRLRAAVALAQQLDEKAVGVLIDLLAELAPTERRLAEQALQQLAGDWSPTPALTGEDTLSRQLRREAWAAWWRTVDGPALVAAFRRRTLNAEELIAAQKLIEQLGDKSFVKRDRATGELIAQGSKVIGLLQGAAKSPDPERGRRVGICLNGIAQNAARDKLPLAAPRLLLLRRPPGATEALLGYVAFTDDWAMSAEIVKTLTGLALVDGKVDTAVLSALSDPLAVRRIVAAEALVGAGGSEHPAVRKLLSDADLDVRMRVALALVHGQDKAGVAVLIDLVVDLPMDKAWQADDLLRRLAGDKAPERLAADDAAARKTLKTAWQGWWKVHGATVNLAVLEKANSFTGLTVIAELGPNGGGGIFGPGGKKGGFNPGGPFGGGPGAGGFGGGGGIQINPPMGVKGPGGLLMQKAAGGKKGKGAPLPAPLPAPMPANPPAAGTDRLVAVDRNGQVQWQIEDLEYPIDFQLLPNGRVLIAEYNASRVTERDVTGKIHWQVNNLLRAPVGVQRLANGNTFITLYNTPASGGGTHIEVDRDGKTVATINNPAGDAAGGAAVPPGAFMAVRSSIIRAGYKMADGQLLCLGSNQTYVRLDAAGKAVKRFALPLYGGVSAVVTQVPNFAGNIDVTPKGHIVVALDDNTVAEYDLDGKVIWQVKAAASRATRLAYGNTLVALQTGGVVELDNAGETVWKYEPPNGYRAVRARRVGYVPLGLQAGAPPQLGN